jgi:tRNA (cytidine/uridine-2'-O-)-methyltransferase
MEPGAALVFGSEGKGLAEFYHKTYPEQFYTIPMPGNFHRSLNLANSVAVAVYEGLRRQQ